MGNNRLEASPKWGNTTKLVVALVFVMIIALIMTFYHTIVGPLLVALITSYLLYPIANFLKTKTKIPWVWAVNLIYIVFILILLILVISGGVFLINQTQALIGFMQKSIKDLPAFLNDFATQKYYIGPFLLDMNTLDIQSIGNQLLGSLQNTIGQVGSLLGTIASSAAGMFGWGFFIVMISYFILSESRGAPEFCLISICLVMKAIWSNSKMSLERSGMLFCGDN